MKDLNLLIPTKRIAADVARAFTYKGIEHGCNTSSS
jgi:hypothetical protein